uniref:Uncharacterized protein n=1 Tax=Strigamia maritima TaxID=126957 RepID=T1IVM1_STRMM
MSHFSWFFILNGILLLPKIVAEDIDPSGLPKPMTIIICIIVGLIIILTLWRTLVQCTTEVKTSNLPYDEPSVVFQHVRAVSRPNSSSKSY